MKSIFFIILVYSQFLFAAEYGVFMVVKGKVRVENAKASVDAKVGSKIEVGDLVVTAEDSRAKIVMSDRNIINISPNSKLKIEKYTNSGDDKNVKINLIEGKVRNNVEQKYDNKNSKFQVRTATAVAGVRGTQFITSYNPKTKVTEVVTLKGEVSFQSLLANGDAANNDGVLVKKGEKSEAKEGASAPAEPVKVPEKEVKALDSDTTVKKDKTEDSKKNTGNATTEIKSGSALVQPGADVSNIEDLKNTSEQTKKNAVERKFDKSKVKIITQPN